MLANWSYTSCPCDRPRRTC